MTADTRQQQRVLDNAKARLAELIQEIMPWPFSDVSRYDDEGTDTAWDIAERVYSRLEREFDDLPEKARAVKRRTYPTGEGR